MFIYGTPNHSKLMSPAAAVMVLSRVGMPLHAECDTDLPTLSVRLSVSLSNTGIECFTLRAKLSGAVYCYRSCLWRAGGLALFVGVFVGLLPQ